MGSCYSQNKKMEKKSINPISYPSFISSFMNFGQAQNYKLRENQFSQQIYEYSNDKQGIQELLFCPNIEFLQKYESELSQIKSSYQKFIQENAKIFERESICKVFFIDSSEKIIILKVQDCELITDHSIEEILKNMQFQDFSALIQILLEAIQQLTQVGLTLSIQFKILLNKKTKRVCIYPFYFEQQLAVQQSQTYQNHIENQNIQIVGKKLLSLIGQSQGLFERINQCYRNFIIDMTSTSQPQTIQKYMNLLNQIQKLNLPVLIPIENTSTSRFNNNNQNNQNQNFENNQYSNEIIEQNTLTSGRGSQNYNLNTYNQKVDQENKIPIININLNQDLLNHNKINQQEINQNENIVVENCNPFIGQQIQQQSQQNSLPNQQNNNQFKMLNSKEQNSDNTHDINSVKYCQQTQENNLEIINENQIPKSNIPGEENFNKNIFSNNQQFNQQFTTTDMKKQSFQNNSLGNLNNDGDFQDCIFINANNSDQQDQQLPPNNHFEANQQNNYTQTIESERNQSKLLQQFQKNNKNPNNLQMQSNSFNQAPQVSNTLEQQNLKYKTTPQNNFNHGFEQKLQQVQPLNQENHQSNQLCQPSDQNSYDQIILNNSSISFMEVEDESSVGVIPQLSNLKSNLNQKKQNDLKEEEVQNVNVNSTQQQSIEEQEQIHDKQMIDENENLNDEQKSDLFLDRGVNCLEQNDIEQAIRNFEISIFYNKRQVYSYLYLGQIYVSIKKDAIQAIIQMNRLEEKKLMCKEAHFILGNALMLNRNYPEALKQLNICIDLKYSLSECYLQQGNVYLREMQNIQAALQSYQAAIQYCEKDQEQLLKVAYKNISYAYLMLSDYNNAMYWLDQAFTNKDDIEYDTYFILFQVQIKNDLSNLNGYYNKYINSTDYLPFFINMTLFIKDFPALKQEHKKIVSKFYELANKEIIDYYPDILQEFQK